MKIYPTNNLPIISWCENPDTNAIEQAKHLAMLPFAFHHIALMPDTHMGFGMPIGAVLATKEEIIVPNAVGVDIGCGMRAIKTNKKASEFGKEALKKIVAKIKLAVPMGFSRASIQCRREIMPTLEGYCPISEREYENARKQMGTLGGGNHFIELQKDNEDNLWIMIHSGSRNIGKRVADHYNEIAEEKLEGTYSKIEKEWKLAFLRRKDGDIGCQYINEMKFCMAFANRNRHEMAIKIMGEIGCLANKEIDICHNYARIEHHFGENVWVHRKGATSAMADELGIIPGSQGSKSYIVVGKGNTESFYSCSHGAGRRMGRKEAMRSLSIEEEIKIMEAKGIVHDIASIEQLDEAPSAYKNIETVMAEQTDLVRIQTELTPIAAIKG